MMAFASEVDYSRVIQDAPFNRELSDRLIIGSDEEAICNFKYDDNFNKFIGQIEMKLLRAIELHDTCNDETASVELKKEMQRAHIDELLASANFLQTLLNFLILYLSRSLQPLNLEIIRLIPSVREFSNLC